MKNRLVKDLSCAGWITVTLYPENKKMASGKAPSQKKGKVKQVILHLTHVQLKLFAAVSLMEMTQCLPINSELCPSRLQIHLHQMCGAPHEQLLAT